MYDLHNINPEAKRSKSCFVSDKTPYFLVYF